MSAAGANKLSPFDLPPLLLTALNSLYSHYVGEFERWDKVGIGVPPVFIVVCQNTAISKLVFEWIAGFERGDAEAGERASFHAGNLELFRNYDEHGGRLPKPRTLLIDSRQLEAGEALDKGFKEAASAEIDQFKRELAAREGAGAIKGEVNESDLLREVMNTVGRPGRLGEQIRCVVSVSMLTEGWDTNTVTHILGVRAFGTQLLCEQVVGRGLRRQSYELNAEGLFDVEYADIMGIPFDFARSPQKVDPRPPKPVTRVHAIAERADLEIRFPRVSGYRRELPSERLNAEFDEDSRLVITPEDIGPTSVTMEGIVGAGVVITPEVLAQLRPSEISFNLAKHLLYTHFRDEDGFPKQHLFPQIQRLARRWIDEGYLVTKGVPIGAILYEEQLARAAEKIDIACTRGGGGHVVAVLDPYNPTGSTRHVNFITSKECWKTGTQPPRSQISHVVKDSSWEVALAQALEGHPRVLAYAKNQALGFEIPYLDGGAMRRYLPDFLVRLDAGARAEPLNLVLEMKGQRDESDKAKAQTARELWVPGVNALGGYGRWAFAEFTDPYTTEDEFKALITKLMDGAAS
jgi:type III restriction enzyme